MRWTLGVLAAAGILGTAAAAFFYVRSRPELYRPGEDHAEITRNLARNLPPDAPLPRFRDVTGEAGLAGFRSFSGPRSSQLPEDMGSGAAWGDFDNDGDEDLFLVSAGGSLGLSPEERAPSLLYANLGDGTFRRVEDFPDTRIIGMGAAWADYDGDGWLDLAVTGYRSLILYRNDAGRFARNDRFPEPDGFWAGASWGDYDADGDPDLYVCGYVQYAENAADRARASLQYGRSVPFTLNPVSFRPERNLLFRNDGGGRFREVAGELGVANPEGRSLSAIWIDLDQDGRLDLYVANDISDNVFYRSLGGRFEDISHPAWVADYRGAMGLAAGDWNRDGDEDLFITHWLAQENALYDSLLADRRSAPAAAPGGPGGAAGAAGAPSPEVPVRFIDVADQRGLGQIALPMVGWGTEFADFDADGWLDLAVANGNTLEDDADPPGLQPQASFLFWNARGGHFHDLAPLDAALARPGVARGLSVADYDGDGDLDILRILHGEGAQLLRNDMQAGNWMKVRLRRRHSSRPRARSEGEGAVVAARAGGVELRRFVGGPSYLSQSSREVHFGLGEATAVDELRVFWPGGGTDTYTGLAAGGVWEIQEGDSEARKVEGKGSPPSAKHLAGGAAAGESRETLVKFWEAQRAAMDAMKVEADFAKAVALFREALALRPGHEDSLYYLANCLAAQGDARGAIGELEALLRVNPRSHRAHRRIAVLRALIASGPGDLEAARAAAATALAINPEETGSLLLLGEIALLAGDPARAEEHLAAACRTNPRAAGGFFLRGYVAWKRGDGARARDLLAATRQALGKEWKPAGTTAEGDVDRQMHGEETPLFRYWQEWDGEPYPDRAFRALDARLRSLPAAAAVR